VSPCIHGRATDGFPIASKGEIVKIVVYGIPQPGGSKRAFVIPGTNRASISDANPKAKPWKNSVAWAAVESGMSPLAGPLELTIEFLFPRPKGHFGTGKNENVLKVSAPIYHTVKPDATKCLRSTEDALKGIAWRDDSQVSIQIVSKRYVDAGESPGAIIRIEQITEPK
jgi:Holliday junction resolvase RusA-like endonuclease